MRMNEKNKKCIVKAKSTKKMIIKEISIKMCHRREIGTN